MASAIRRWSRLATLLLCLVGFGTASPGAARDLDLAADLAARVERDADSGAVFLRRAMSRDALEVLDSWRQEARGSRYGGAARRLAPLLDGLDRAAFIGRMAQEVGRGGARHSRVAGVAGHAGRKQVMDVWEWRDGTIVRFKPEGDPRRDAPTYSVEVKDARMLDNESARQGGVAFKVDPRARAVPTGPRQVAVPPDLPPGRVDDYVDAVMALGHRTLARPPAALEKRRTARDGR